MKRTQTRLVRTSCTATFAALLLVLVGGLTGCASRTPNLDAQFGKSVRLLNAQQTINPNAMANTDPVLGLDGKAALSGYGDYQKTFANPEPRGNSFTIGIGN